MDIFEIEASNIIKRELLKREMNYKDLSVQLKSIGVKESSGQIANKLARGTFSFSFALKCFQALNIKDLKFSNLENVEPINLLESLKIMRTKKLELKSKSIDCRVTKDPYLKLTDKEIKNKLDQVNKPS